MCLGHPANFTGCHPGGSPREAYELLRDGVLAGWPPNADRVVGDAPLEIAVELSFSDRLANAVLHKLSGPSRLALNSPVIPMTWEQPLTGELVLGLITAQ